MNETIAEGKLTWCRHDKQFSVDFLLVNESEREKVMRVWIGDKRKFNRNFDQNLLLVRHGRRTVKKGRDWAKVQ